MPSRMGSSELVEKEGTMTMSLEQYGELLEHSGMPEREQARAYVYATEYGVEALSGPGCVTFAEPSCGDWNCMNPRHQVLDKESPGSHGPRRGHIKRRRRP